MGPTDRPTPDELKAYLDVLRAGGCVSVEMAIPGLNLRAVFAPSVTSGDSDLPPTWPDWRGEP
jgi:hypothetical protein